MRVRVLLIGAFVLSVFAASAAEGKPNFGVPCSSCHMLTSGKVEVTGEDKVLDLGTQLDGLTPGSLKTFVVSPGETASLQVNVLSGSGDLVFSGLDKGGQQNDASNSLDYGVDGSWAQQGSGALAYFTKKVSSAGVDSYELVVNAGTPGDVYNLRLGMAGKDGGLWSQQIQLYVEVAEAPPADPVISGVIAAADGTGIDGVSVDADNGGGSAVTDASGAYSLTVPYDWSGSVVPSKADLTFEPASVAYDNVTADAADEDYVGSLPPFTAGDHVLRIEIDQVWDYQDPLDPNDLEFMFYFLIETDAEVDQVGVLTPAGETFNIGKDAHTQVGGVETWYNQQGDTYFWAYEDRFADVNGFGKYGDGGYSVVVLDAAGADSATSVWFGIPDTNDAIGQPTQEPVLVAPAHNGQVESPVTLEWSPVIDENVASIWIGLNNGDANGVVELTPAIDANSSAPVALVGGAWNTMLSFEHGYDYTNADGIAATVWKYSEGSYAFEVNTPDVNVPVVDIIIDNGDEGTGSVRKWRSSTEGSFYGEDSLYSRHPHAAYNFETELAGTYEVSLWWTSESKHAGDVVVGIFDGDELLDILVVDQSVGGGQWNLLGVYNFSTAGRVVLVPGSKKAYISADAVKFSTTSQDVDGTITIDNDDSGTSSTGEWRPMLKDRPYGLNSLVNKHKDAAYTFETALSGVYEVKMWWPAKGGLSKEAVVEIYDGETLVQTVVVNQKVDAGKWNSLGAYTFADSAKVVLLSGKRRVCADAVSFVPTAEPFGPPTAGDGGQDDDGDDDGDDQGDDDDDDQGDVGDEAIVVITADYDREDGKLKVRAVSGVDGAVLMVEGYGVMTFKSDKGRYEYEGKEVADPAGTVTVTSDKGDSVTVKVVCKGDEVDDDEEDDEDEDDKDDDEEDDDEDDV